MRSDATYEKLSAANFDAIVIPGGYSPDHVRRYPEVLALVKKMHDENKIIAFIWHAAWVPISAGIIRGKRVTCYPSLR